MPSGRSSVDHPNSAGHPPADRLPAFIFLKNETAPLRIAALTVLDRLIVAIHRAGAGPISIVTTTPLPALDRSRALGIAFEVIPTAPKLESPALVTSTSLLVQPADVRRCLGARSAILANDGAPLPIGVVESIPDPSETAILSQLSRRPSFQSDGVACPVVDPASARSAERALWSSMTSSADGFVDKAFNRPCGRPLSKMLIHTAVTPNMVSITSILVGVVSAFFFANGHYHATVFGALLFQLSAIIDCVDGEIARVVFKESPLGKWIDLAGDQIVHISVFAGIALGISRVSASSSVLWLGVSAVLGALLSFFVILRGMRSPSGPGTLLKRLIDAATNRDFSVLVLILACFGNLDLFLWMAAIGSHIFWLAALSIQFASARPKNAASLKPGI